MFTLETLNRRPVTASVAAGGSPLVLRHPPRNNKMRLHEACLAFEPNHRVYRMVNQPCFLPLQVICNVVRLSHDSFRLNDQ